jgi:hypothetical protein
MRRVSRPNYEEEVFCWEFISSFQDNEAVHQLFKDFKKTYNSLRREGLYNILIEFEVPMMLVSSIEMCLNEEYSRSPDRQTFV